mgnify:CR=1 FL=1
MKNFDKAQAQIDSLQSALNLEKDDLTAFLEENTTFLGMHYYLANAQVQTLLFLDQKQQENYQSADEYWTKLSNLFDYDENVYAGYVNYARQINRMISMSAG